jgi:hypothetical protein
MPRLNILGFDTSHGFRTAELQEGDVTVLDFVPDILVVSAFAFSYEPTPGSIFGALKSELGIDVARYEREPALDMRSALSIWVSGPLPAGAAFKRLLCVEMTGGHFSMEEAIENVFAGLMLLAAKDVATDTVALPLLGAGHQQFAPKEIASVLVTRAKRYLNDAPFTKRLVFVERESGKARQLNEAIERVLGRSKVTLPQEQLVGALKQDVLNRLNTAQSLFAPDCLSVREDWVRLLTSHEIRAVDFGIGGRKLVELLLSRLGSPQQFLAKRIRALEEGGSVAPWICAYMHVLRHLGNDSAHQAGDVSAREPAVVASGDLTAGLFCVQRLLEFWIDHEHRVSLI